MSYKKAFFLTISLFFVCTLSLAAPHSFLIDRVEVFGNSFSDNGNTYRVSGETYPGEAYSEGRFSDGPTWATYFVKHLGLDVHNPKQFRNFAYGQAQILGTIRLKTHARSNPKKTWFFDVPDLRDELDLEEKTHPRDPSKTLYLIFMGANDFLNYVVHTEKQNHAFVLKTFHALADQVAWLKRQGAHHIVVFNLRHLEATPLARQLNEQFGQHYLVKLSKMIADFNDHLDNFYAADDKVWVYDVYTFDRKPQIKPHEYVRSGKPRLMFEMVRPCYVNQGNYIERMGASCPNPWVYFYYDRIHPTTYTHALMAEDLYRQWRLTLKRQEVILHHGRLLEQPTVIPLGDDLGASLANYRC